MLRNAVAILARSTSSRSWLSLRGSKDLLDSAQSEHVSTPLTNSRYSSPPQIQCSAAVLYSQQWTEGTGKMGSVWRTFWTRFTAMWPTTNLSIGIVSPRFAKRTFAVIRLCVVPDAWRTTAHTAADQNRQIRSQTHPRCILAVTTVDEETDNFDELSGRHILQRTLRVCAWVTRFMWSPGTPKCYMTAHHSRDRVSNQLVDTMGAVSDCVYGQIPEWQAIIEPPTQHGGDTRMPWTHPESPSCLLARRLSIHHEIREASALHATHDTMAFIRESWVPCTPSPTREESAKILFGMQALDTTPPACCPKRERKVQQHLKLWELISLDNKVPKVVKNGA